ncbi:MAG: hypothetical protein PHT35_01180 [Bacteroidales bacterium]|nr:hypothetical protein [Bacteroidales bacterium]MDD4435538.1 hypothetical protein [Bacteroidales bacterium]
MVLLKVYIWRSGDFSAAIHGVAAATTLFPESLFPTPGHGSRPQSGVEPQRSPATEVEPQRAKIQR